MIAHKKYGGANVKRVYLDNCCFNRPYDDQSRLMIELETNAKLKIQKMIVDGRLELVTSYILEQENDDNPHLERKSAIEDFFKYAATDLDETQEIIAIAKIAADTGLKSKDSLHVACAIVANCDYLLTTDRRFLNYKNDKIQVLNPIQFLIEMKGAYDD